MSWLDEDLESKVSVLTIHETSYREHRRIIAASCLRSAYEGGFKDGAGELAATRELLRDSAERTAELENRVRVLPVETDIAITHPVNSLVALNWPAVGTRVRSRREFAGIPEGPEGVVDEDYGTGVIVAWDLADRPLPAGYAIRCTVSTFKPQDQYEPGAPLRDGFDRATELDMLEEVS